jgi:hypothetical protein
MTAKRKKMAVINRSLSFFADVFTSQSARLSLATSVFCFGMAFLKLDR